jgi:hypothetical protein
VTDAHLVPALITELGEQASWRYVELFTANIRNPEHAPRLCSHVSEGLDRRGSRSASQWVPA